MTAELLLSGPPTGSAPLAAVRVAVETIADVEDLLAALPADVGDADLLAWVRDGSGVVGWGTAALAEFHGPDRLDAAARWWSSVVGSGSASVSGSSSGAAGSAPGSGPESLVAFVATAFADDSRSSTLVRVPAVALLRRRGVTVLVRAAGEGQDLPPRPALAVAPLPTSPGVPRFSDGHLDGDGWSAAVGTLVARLRAGEARKVVLARELRAELPGPVDLRRPLRLLARDYPSCWVYAVDGLFGATPELLLRRTGANVASRVLAGTVRRGPDAGTSGTELASSKKDRDEHRLAAQSVAHVLRLRCRDVGLTGPHLLELPNVLHLATDLFATLAPTDRDPGALLSLAGQLHPTAAVGGTPRAAAVALLAAAEGFDRGRYGAPVGWIDGTGDGELGLALRCGQLNPDDPRCVTLYAGAGIVSDSDPAAELAETDAKFLPVIGALGG